MTSLQRHGYKENKKVAYCVDFLTVHHCTKFRSHICNMGDFTEGGTLCPPVQGSKEPGINRVNIKHLQENNQSPKF